MPLALTQNARNALNSLSTEPQIVLEIDGVTTIYGARNILKYVRIGDPGLVIGDAWTIGGFNSVDDQEELISLDGTTAEISQQLDPTKATVSSISSLQIALLDENEQITRLISPGLVVTDMLGRRCKVYLGFAGTAWPEDYFTIFRGIVDDIISDQGVVTFNIAHPDQKKRQELFQKVDAELSAPIDAIVTTIPVDSTLDFLEPVLGPDGLNDTSLKFYVRINDEIIRYAGLTPTSFTGCIRAGGVGNTDIPGNVAAAHDAEDTVDSFYRLTGNGIDLALKLMMSGFNGYFATGVDVTAFERLSSTETADNALFFFGVDIAERYGLTVGDYVTTTGAANGANNVTLKTISEIQKTVDGSYLVLNGVTFAYEADTDATVSFRSRYDTLGEGLKMYPDEVDVTQHTELKRLFLSGLNYDFYLKDTMNGKDFINAEIYNPGALYSVPRKAKASAQYHIGPIPGANTPTLNIDNVKSPSKIRLRRTTEKNFYNHIVYRFDEDAFEDGRFHTNRIVRSQDSLNQIENRGAKTLTLAARGVRSDLGGVTLSDQQAARRLRRYEFAAEFFEKVEVLPEVGFTIEVGDIILLDGVDLNISDIKTGERGMVTRFFEVVNRRFNLKTCAVSLTLMDTGYSTSNRYALIGPSSRIKSAVSASQFVIESGQFSSLEFGANEGLKWARYSEPQIRVRKPDFSQVSTSVITGVSSNTIEVTPALSFTPANGDILELSSYTDQTDQIKLLYGHMQNNATFGDGKSQYKML